MQTIKQECLDHFLAFGQQHFDPVREFVRYYHERFVFPLPFAIGSLSA